VLAHKHLLAVYGRREVFNKPVNEADDRNKKQAVRSKWENANPFCHSGRRAGIL
jgi:hypothetical protein